MCLTSPKQTECSIVGFFPVLHLPLDCAECTLFLQQVVVYKNWKWPLGYWPVVLQVTLRHSRATRVQGCHEITGRRMVWVSPHSKLGTQGLASPFCPASPSLLSHCTGSPLMVPPCQCSPEHHHIYDVLSYLVMVFPFPSTHHDISCACTGLTLTHCQSPELSFSPQILMGQVLWDL